jgi:hypothetical protein
MIKQNVNIVNFNQLYEILNEIKENLSFNIIKYENEDDVIKSDADNILDSLFVLKKDDKLLSNKSLSNINFLYFEDLPLPINRLIELINIHLLKLKFNYQSKISIKTYEMDLNSKFLSKNNINLKLTEKEIEIILYLSSKKTKQGVLNLQKDIWGYASDLETHTVETHIYRLRKKISSKFSDDKFILSHQDGYYIE